MEFNYTFQQPSQKQNIRKTGLNGPKNAAMYTRNYIRQKQNIYEITKMCQN